MVNNITPTIKYIGVDDLDIDLFESQYEVPNGMVLQDASLHTSLLITWNLTTPPSLQRWLRNIRR